MVKGKGKERRAGGKRCRMKIYNKKQNMQNRLACQVPSRGMSFGRCSGAARGVAVASLELELELELELGLDAAAMWRHFC